MCYILGMSIEADLDAFRDLALEEQIKIPYYEKKYGDIAIIYRNLDPILDEMIGDRSVVLTGDVYRPVYDGLGRFEGRQKTSEPVIGLANGVEVASRDNLVTGEAGKLLVWYCVQADEAGEVELSHMPRFTFAPVESSTLSVPGLLVPEHQLLPEPDDEAAFEIDQCLLAEDLNLSELIRIFNRLDKLTDMQIEYCLNYLNNVLPLSDYEITIQTEEILSGDDDGYFSVSRAEEGTVLELSIKPSSFEYIKDLGLSMSDYRIVDDAEDDDYLLFPLRSVHKLSFTNL